MTEKTWNINVPISGDKFEVDALLERFFEARDQTGMSTGKFSRHLWEIGLGVAEKDLKDKGKIDPVKYAIAQESDRIRCEKGLEKQLEDIYQELGLFGFVEWAKSNNVPVESFLREHSWENRELQWHKRAVDWLGKHLLDGQPCPTTEIKRRAIEDELINDSDDDWEKLRKVASRNGFTNSEIYGHWQFKVR